MKTASYKHISQPDDTQWCAMEALLDKQYILDFMYMGTVLTFDQKHIHLYKHIDTRRYLNIDDEGKTYHYRGEKDCYEPCPLNDALQRIGLPLAACLQVPPSPAA